VMQLTLLANLDGRVWTLRGANFRAVLASWRARIIELEMTCAPYLPFRHCSWSGHAALRM